MEPEIDERITDEIEPLFGFMRISLSNRNLTLYNPYPKFVEI